MRNSRRPRDFVRKREGRPQFGSGEPNDGRIRNAALVGVLAAGPSLVPAVAESPVPSPVANGRRCAFRGSLDWPGGEGDVQSSEIDGGPLVAASPGARVTMTCTIRTQTDLCTAASGPALQVVVVPPTLCAYPSPGEQAVYRCMEIEVNGPAWYWDPTLKSPPDPTNPEPARGWTTDSTTRCGDPIIQGAVSRVRPAPSRPGRSGDPDLRAPRHRPRRTEPVTVERREP